MENALFGSNVNAPVVSTLRVAEIQPDPKQPRKHFEKEALKELAATIKEKGLIQPIIVRSKEDGDGYTIIAGERRWRAVQLNGAETIQAIVRNDLDARAASLIENIQRQNLRPVEEADAIAILIEEENLSQGDVAAMLGMGRASINQLLKIRNLPEELKQESIASDTPKSILVELTSIKDEKLIKKLWARSKKEALSIADIRRVRDAAKKHKEAAEEEAELSLQERMIRRAFDALEVLKNKPLSEAERARLVELQAKIAAMLDGEEV
jgi:ParB family chromosome partitioning protein